MGHDWRALSLEEAGVRLIDCVHKTPTDAGTGYPYIAIPQLKPGHIDFAGASRRITQKDFLEWTKKARPAAGDVVLSRRCNPGETAFVHGGTDFALGQNLVLLRADGQVVLPQFLRWLVRGPEWWQEVARFINVGAIFDSLRCGDVPKFVLTVPPRPQQSAIADILGSLDDKIELNRRMNETLQEMARALFKSWFVDFDPVRAKAAGRKPVGMDAETAKLFPREFEQSELGEIPKGWKHTSLADLTTKIGSGATPKGGKEVYVESGVALIRSQNVYDSLFVWDGLARITDDAARRLDGVTVHSGDVLLNITGASFLRTCVAEDAALPARVNQHVAIIRAKPKVPSHFIHLHLLREQTKAYLMGMDAGASRQAVTKAHIESVRMVVPPEPTLTRFDHVVSPTFAMIALHNAEMRTLAETRDTLLPRLLSGELSVKHAERILEATV